MCWAPCRWTITWLSLTQQIPASRPRDRRPNGQHRLPGHLPQSHAMQARLTDTNLRPDQPSDTPCGSCKCGFMCKYPEQGRRIQFRSSSSHSACYKERSLHPSRAACRGCAMHTCQRIQRWTASCGWSTTSHSRASTSSWTISSTWTRPLPQIHPSGSVGYAGTGVSVPVHCVDPSADEGEAPRCSGFGSRPISDDSLSLSACCIPVRHATGAGSGSP